MGFARLGRFLVHRRRWVLILAAILFVAAGMYGGDVASRLSNGGFADPNAESTQAQDYLTDTLHAGTPNVVLVVRPAHDGATVDDATVTGAGSDVTRELAAQPSMQQVTSYWALGSPPPLASRTKDSALVLGHLDGDEDQVRHGIKDISERFNREGDVTVVQVGGLAEAYHQVGDTIEQDLKLAEMIALPITLLVLVLVFRSVVSALLPLAAGAFAIVGTFVVLKVLSEVTLVSIFSLNLTTALGLGLAIDYALFIVSRYREERANGLVPHDAVATTVATAGRSVVFSGLTVAVSLGALLVFPIAFLRSFAYAGIPVVAMAVIGSVVVLPALLAVLGDRIEKLTIRRPRKVAPVRSHPFTSPSTALSVAQRGRVAAELADPIDPEIERSFWYRAARRVMKRPVFTATAVVFALLVLAAPFLHLDVGLPDDRVLPTTASSRQVGDTLREGYSSQETGALSVVLPNAQPSAEVVDAYAVALSGVRNVARVDAPTGIYLKGAKVLPPGPITERFTTPGGQWLSVVPSVEPVSDQGEQLVHDVRAVPAPVEAFVGGTAPQLVDTKEAIFARLPWALAIIVVATFVLLFLSFGSVLVPIKALVLNTLSLTATFGAMVWIFQDGHLSSTLGFTPTGVLDLTTPILMFCIAFGMSMDYEVFLLSRIKEEHDRTGDNERSVAVGLAKTGRIITAAAATIAVVFIAFATSSVSFIKLFGIGLALAVIMDATVIRATLVPAFMRLAGDANWWAPRWMRWIYDRAGMQEVPAGTVVRVDETASGAEPLSALDLRSARSGDGGEDGEADGRDAGDREPEPVGSPG